MNLGRYYGEIRQDLAMPAIVDYPTAVKQALEEFRPLLANEPEHRQFAITTDQSCLNCQLTEVQWDQKTDTRYIAQAVSPLTMSWLTIAGP